MISVIIPVYNVEQYLDECVKSVVNQTYKNLEIILVDDGSTDNSGKRCDEYARTDERIRVIHKQNGGLSSARNAGIEIAEGEYFTFIDSDDYITSDMVEQLLFVVEKTGADISSCRMARDEQLLDIGIDEDISVFTPTETLGLLLQENKLLTSASFKLYKRELFENIRYPEGKLYEDLGTTYKLIHLSNKVAFVDVRKYYYRTNPESITKSNFTNKQLDYYEIAAELRQFIEKNYPEHMRSAKNHSVRMSVAFMRKISVCGFNDKKTIAFLVSDIRKNIFGYLSSGYSIFSKLYGLLICVSPSAALKLFKYKSGGKG